MIVVSIKAITNQIKNSFVVSSFIYVMRVGIIALGVALGIGLLFGLLLKHLF